MSCACEFQPAIQIDCVLDLLRLIRGGSLIESRAEALQHAGCIIGSLGKYLEGDVVAMSDEPLPCDLDECADLVEHAIPGDAVGALAINPALLALLLKLAELLIEKYL